MKTIFIIIIVCGSFIIPKAQVLPTTNNSATQYLEGARLVIDILQLFKKSNVIPVNIRQQKNGGFCNFCLYNSDTVQKIKVTLISKNIQQVDPIILVIKPIQKECSFQIQCGIYNCKIEAIDEKIISWGDIFINEKQVSITK